MFTLWLGKKELQCMRVYLMCLLFVESGEIGQ